MIINRENKKECRQINYFLFLIFIAFSNFVEVTSVVHKNFATFRKGGINNCFRKHIIRAPLFIHKKFLKVKKKKTWNIYTNSIKSAKEVDTVEKLEMVEGARNGKCHDNFKKKNEIISRTADLVKYLNFDFKEECNDIIMRIGNFLEVSPQLLFKYVCVNLKKLYTNLYTNENINIPFASTEHTLHVDEETTKTNKFKISCILGLKVLKLFLIKYLRSIRLCIPPEVRKRYIYDFLKIEYLSKIYNEKYNLVDISIYNNLSDKMKSKLIYFYLSRNPYDVPNILIKIFKAAGYTNENEVLYKYILKSEFTSRGGKRFRRIITKEYKKLFESHKTVKKHSEKDILWIRFLSLLKKHNGDILKETKILRNSYQYIFSPINLYKDKIVQLFEKRGFQIFGPNEKELKEMELKEMAFPKELCKKSDKEDVADAEENATELELLDEAEKKKKKQEIKIHKREIKNQKLKIGRERKNCIFNFITNLRKFMLYYIKKSESIDHPFYYLKTNLNIPKNIFYDEKVSKKTNVFHLANQTTHKETEDIKNGDTALTTYVENILNNFLDEIIDILIENAGFKNIKTLFAIYKSLINEKQFRLIHFRNKL